MIIFGTKTYVTVLAVVSLVCQHCQHPAAQRLQRLQRRFTLFFVPLFPVSTRHVLDCTWCGTQSRLSAAEATDLAARGALPR